MEYDVTSSATWDMPMMENTAISKTKQLLLEEGDFWTNKLHQIPIDRDLRTYTHVAWSQIKLWMILFGDLKIMHKSMAISTVD